MITIIGLIMSLVGPRVLNYLSDSKVKAAKIQIQSFTSALELFYLDAGRYPSTSEGLAALVKSTGGLSAWNGPYLKGGQLPNDPWGKPYIYRSPGERSPYRDHLLRRRRRRRRNRACGRHHDRSRMNRPRLTQDGFTLLETVCVMAIIAMLAAVLLPLLPRATSRPRLEAYAMETAALLNRDRTAAMRTRVAVSTKVDGSCDSVRIEPARRADSG